MQKLKVRLYNSRPVAGQSFKEVKKVVTPNQSMTLHQILERFRLKESLPVQHEGVYEERFGDLEKMGREDFTVRQEFAKTLASAIDSGMKAKRKAKEEEDKKVMEEEIAKRVAAAAAVSTPKEDSSKG